MQIFELIPTKILDTQCVVGNKCRCKNHWVYPTSNQSKSWVTLSSQFSKTSSVNEYCGGLMISSFNSDAFVIVFSQEVTVFDNDCWIWRVLLYNYTPYFPVVEGIIFKKLEVYFSKIILPISPIRKLTIYNKNYVNKFYLNFF